LRAKLFVLLTDKPEYNRNYHRAKGLLKKATLKEQFLREVAELRRRILPEVIAYIAGVIDGEGCITFQSDNRRRLLRGREIATLTFRPYVSVGMTNKECLTFIHTAIGFGSLRFRGHEPPLRSSWEYCVTGHHNIALILGLVNSYLIVKKRQGELTYEFCLSRMFEEHPRHGALDKSGYSVRERGIVAEVKSLQIKSQRK
jgi:hypothetical protein